MTLTKEWITCSKACLWKMYLKSWWLTFVAFPLILLQSPEYILHFPDLAMLFRSGKCLPSNTTLYEHLSVLKVQTPMEPPRGVFRSPSLSLMLSLIPVWQEILTRHLCLLFHHMRGIPHSRENGNLVCTSYLSSCQKEDVGVGGGLFLCCCWDLNSAMGNRSPIHFY